MDKTGIGIALGLMPVGLIAALVLGAAEWQPHVPAHAVLFVGILMAPVVEEIVFRGGLQSLLCTRQALGVGGIGPFSWANLMASLVFALGHGLLRHSPYAALVFFPSLVFGWLYDRNDATLLPVIGVHAFYNLVWLTLLVGA